MKNHGTNEHGADLLDRQPSGCGIETEGTASSDKIVSITTVMLERRRLKDQLRQKSAKLRASREIAVEAIALTIEMRDPYTAGHQRRVAELATAIAREMGLPRHQIDLIGLAATIHDLGKIRVPAGILSKPGPISEQEFNLVKAHAQIAYDVLSRMDLLSPIAPIVLQHHERMDGSGYPSGLTAGEIMIEARVLGVADVVEAMASHRPYRPALGVDSGLREITGQAGRLYDPRVANACLRVFHQRGFQFRQLEPAG